MLTIKRLESIKSGTIFETGNQLNLPNGIYMTDHNYGRPLRWVAVVGGNNDWAVYSYWASGGWTDEEIARSGQKVTNLENIHKLVTCDEESLKRYRM